MLANHGSVVAGKGLEAAVYAVEELEETAWLALLLRGLTARGLDDAQIRGAVTHFDVEWD
jgi:3-dehydro-4-phosphotetronate decarboxylase